MQCLPTSGDWMEYYPRLWGNPSPYTPPRWYSHLGWVETGKHPMVLLTVVVGEESGVVVFLGGDGGGWGGGGGVFFWGGGGFVWRPFLQTPPLLYSFLG